MVLVSHTHRFIFLKTRKTAGTSIEMALQPFCTPPGTAVTEKTRAMETAEGVVGQRLYRPDQMNDLDRKWFHHIAAHRIRDQLGAATFAAYLKLTSVRNPFDRMVSAFHWDRESRKRPELADFADIRKAFRAYVLDTGWNDDRVVTHVGADYVPQDAIRYERMAEDLARVSARLGIALPDAAALPVTKSTGERRKTYPVAEYFDADTIARVRKKLGWVFDHYAYPPLPGA